MDVAARIVPAIKVFSAWVSEASCAFLYLLSSDCWFDVQDGEAGKLVIAINLLLNWLIRDGVSGLRTIPT